MSCSFSFFCPISVVSQECLIHLWNISGENTFWIKFVLQTRGGRKRTRSKSKIRQVDRVNSRGMSYSKSLYSPKGLKPDTLENSSSRTQCTTNHPEGNETIKDHQSPSILPIISSHPQQSSRFLTHFSPSHHQLAGSVASKLTMLTKAIFALFATSVLALPQPSSEFELEKRANGEGINGGWFGENNGIGAAEQAAPVFMFARDEKSPGSNKVNTFLPLTW